MKLLITAQTLDEEDPVLGFFVGWVKEISQYYEAVEVICLYEGSYSLPNNVRVYSLGKEHKPRHSLVYAARHFSLVWRLRNHYDASFVHMNQEYILIAGWYWKLMKKNIYLWRNHYAGSYLTDIAAGFCHRVFYTSKHSYTAKYKNAKQMPVGIDLNRYKRVDDELRKHHSILFLGRMAPSKKPEVLVEALAILKKQNVVCTATFVGSPLTEDEAFYTQLKQRTTERDLDNMVVFETSVPPAQAPDYFSRADIFVNCSRSGMFDKTLFEASACGALVLATSEDFAQLTHGVSFFQDAVSLAEQLKKFINLSKDDHTRIQNMYGQLALKQSLTELVRELRNVIL